METLIAVLRSLHIAAGMIALVVAPVALLTVKGGPAHRRWGKIYFWMMAVVAATAFILALYRPVVFLALLAVFSFYNAFFGYRALYRKRPWAGEGPAVVDWAAAGLTFAASAAIAVLGVVRPNPTWVRLGTVAVVVGMLGMILAGRHLWKFAYPSAERQAWWFNHMAGMLGSYIATVSAFSAVNFTMLPVGVRWLWPTFLGVPLIIAWVTYYKRHFRSRASAAATAAA